MATDRPTGRCPGCGANVYIDAGMCELCGRSLDALLRLHREQQARSDLRTQLAVLAEESIALFETAPKHLGAAETYLDQAEVEFRDRAFAPFWDCVEKATNALGRFDEVTRKITGHVSRYHDLAKRFGTAPPVFPIVAESVAKLGVSVASAARLNGIVRTAQRDFEFATIYEQRRTNNILVAGFTSLAHALDRMSWHLSASIQDLTASVETMTSTLDESIRGVDSRMGDIHDALSDAARHHAQRQKEALTMLDNIQRGRRPYVA